MNLNVNDWKEFCVNRLFECSTTTLSVKESLNDGDVPFISRSAINNGCDGHVNVDEEAITKGKCLTIGAEGLYCFYQPNDFATGNKVYTLRNKNLNIFHYLFIATILNQEVYKYNYGRARIKSKLEKEIIKLPILKDVKNNPIIDEDKKYSDDGYIPDWNYMENYIKKLPHLPIETNNKSESILLIELEKWQDFKIGDLFEIYPTKQYPEMSSNDLNDGGNVPFVINSAENNGIGGKSSLEATEKRNIITFSDTTDGNTFFYQPEDFIGFSHVQGMHPKNHIWDKEELLFLTSILMFHNKGLFNYGRKMRRDIISNTFIKLPIQYENGQPKIDTKKTYSKNGYIPDWDYMKQYIKSLPYGDLI